MTNEPKHDVDVQLTGVDGNAFSVVGEVSRALKDAGVSDEENAEFVKEAFSDDYDHLLATCCRWVNVS